MSSHISPLPTKPLFSYTSIVRPSSKVLLQQDHQPQNTATMSASQGSQSSQDENCSSNPNEASVSSGKPRSPTSCIDFDDVLRNASQLRIDMVEDTENYVRELSEELNYQYPSPQAKAFTTRLKAETMKLFVEVNLVNRFKDAGLWVDGDGDSEENIWTDRFNEGGDAFCTKMKAADNLYELAVIEALLLGNATNWDENDTLDATVNSMIDQVTRLTILAEMYKTATDNKKIIIQHMEMAFFALKSGHPLPMRGSESTA